MDERQWLSSTDPIAMVEHLRGSPTSEDTVTWWSSRWQFDEAPTGYDRKFRMFACACCRRIWEHIPEACNRDAVVAVEDFLDGHCTSSELQAALASSSSVEWKEDGTGRRSEPGYWAVKYLGRGFSKMTAAVSALLVCSQVLFLADEAYGREARYEFDICFYPAGGVFLRPFQWPAPVPAAIQAEREAQGTLLRCLFGNPFRTLPPCRLSVLTWNNGIVKRLAGEAYKHRLLPSGQLDPQRLAVLADALEEAGADAEMVGHLRGPEHHVRGCAVVDVILGR